MELQSQKASLAINIPRLAQVIANLLLSFAPTLIVILAIALRLYGINWDQQGLFHPDERAILFHVNDMSWPPLHKLHILLDAEQSPLNPKWFPYGSLPLYSVKVLELVSSPFMDFGFTDLRFLGRGLSALVDVGTVIMVLLISTRLYSRPVGILASLLAAIALLHIQLSHFYTVDTYLTFFIVTSVYFLVRFMQNGHTRYSMLSATFIGLALACKISVAPIFLAFVSAHIMRRYSDNGNRDSLGWQSPPMYSVKLIVRNIVLGGIISIIAFFIATPYAFIDWYRPSPCDVPFSFLKFMEHNYFACEIGAQFDMVRGTSGLPFTQQYIDTTPYWYHIKQLAIFGLGPPLGIVAWLSVLFTIGIALARRNRGDLLLLACVIPYFLFTGYLEVKFLRYMLPLTPFLLIMSSRMLLWIQAEIATRSPKHLPIARWGLVLLVSLTSIYALSYMHIYANPHTAIRASDWIKDNAKVGSVILMEHWEEGMPNIHGYVIGCRGLAEDAKSCMKMYDFDKSNYSDGLSKIEHIANQLAGADYLVLFSNRLYGSISRIPDIYPDSSAYYKKLFGGELGYQLEHWEATYPKFMGVSLVDDTFTRPNLPIPKEMGSFRPSTFVINLGYADESFSVYDHPKVLIFKNQAHLSSSQMLMHITETPPVMQQEKTLLLSDAEQFAHLNGGTWTDIFDNQSLSNRFPVAVWIIWIQGLSLLLLPVVLLLFKALPDRGYILSKPLSILIIAYLAWLFASFEWMPFSRSSILLASLMMAIVAIILVYTRQVDVFGFLRQNIRMVIIGEAVFLGSFLLFLVLRAANPDLWHPFQGGEKPMEMAYLNAVVRSTYMPPYDPWFSGGYINYYYFGQLIVASLVKVTGILPEVAFNLAVPLFFALTAAGAFSITYNLSEGTRRSTGISTGRTSPVLAGFTAVIFVAFIGNLDGIVQVAQGIARVWLGDQPFGTFDFWRSSRVISPGDGQGHEISEFPFWTFLFGDLHAHLMAIPFTLLSMGIALNIALQLRNGIAIIPRVVHIFILALAVGSLRVINTWDFPTYLLLGVAAIFIGEYSYYRQVNLRVILKTGVQGATLYWMTTLLFSQFIDNYQSFSTGIVGSKWQTPIFAYICVHGLFIFVIGSFIANTVRHISPPLLGRISTLPTNIGLGSRLGVLVSDSKRAMQITVFLGIILSLFITLVIMGYVTVAFISILMLGTTLVALTWMYGNTEQLYGFFALALLGASLAIGTGVELVTIKGDIDRMNTVFKFYIQAWILMGVVAAYFLWRIDFGREILGSKFRLHKSLLVGLGVGLFITTSVFILIEFGTVAWTTYTITSALLLWRFGVLERAFTRKMQILRGLWVWILLALVLSSSIYTLAGTQDRLRDRFRVTDLTLNGLAYMEHAVYNFDQGTGSDELIWDYQAIQWLRGDAVQGSPVILEGQGELYRTLHGRVSIYTGLPTVLGWDNHQSQQRGYGKRIRDRTRDVEKIYSGTNIEQTMDLLNKYQVQYIYVGELERHYYLRQGLDTLDRMLGTNLELAYENTGVRIYRVLRNALRFEGGNGL